MTAMKRGLSFVAVLLVGALLGFLVGIASVDQPVPVEPPRSDDVGALQPTAAPPAEGATPGASRERNPVRDASRSGGDRESLGAFLASLPEPVIPDGTGTIQVSVRTEDDTPLPGARITISCWPPREVLPSPYSGGVEPDLAEIVDWHARRNVWHTASERTDVTDSNGELVFERLLDTHHKLEATADGYAISLAERGVHLSRVKPGTVVRLVARPVVGVVVEMVLPGGTAPSKGSVRYRQHGVLRTARWSAASPTVPLPLGTFEASALAGEHEEFLCDPREVTVAAGNAPLKFILRARPGIRGRVIFPKGEERSDAGIYLVRVPEGATVTASVLEDSHPKTFSNQLSEHAFHFKDLEPGHYVLGASRRWSKRVVVSGEVDVGAEPVEHDLVIPPLRRDEYLVVRAIGPDGEALQRPRASITYLRRSGGGGSTGPVPVALYPKPGGVVWVAYDLDQIVGEGRVAYDVTVTSRGLGARRFPLPRGDAPELTVRFDEPAVLDVTLHGYAGTSLVGRLRLSLVEVSTKDVASGWSDLSDSFDLDGRTRFESVQPGSYELVLYLMAKPSWFQLLRSPVAVAAGANTAALTVPQLYELRVEGARDRVSLSGMGVWRNKPAPEDGRLVFRSLPAGEYHVSCSGTAVKVSIPSSLLVQF